MNETQQSLLSELSKLGAEDAAQAKGCTIPSFVTLADQYNLTSALLIDTYFDAYDAGLAARMGGVS